MNNNKHEKLALVTLVILVFFFAHMHHKSVNKIHYFTDVRTLEVTQQYLNLIKINADTLKRPLQKIQVGFSIDSLVCRGKLKVVLQALNNKNQSVLNQSKAIFYSVETNQSKPKTYHFFLLDDALNKQVCMYKLFLFNPGHNAAKISNIQIDVQ